jgi:acetolactate synthase-1/3 small subunit
MPNPSENTHVISIWVENEFGVLSRVASLFSARGYNIESLCVAPTIDSTMSRIILVTQGSDAVIEQIIKQLRKLIPVIKVVDLSQDPHVERELLLVKVNAVGEGRAEAIRIAEIFRGKVVDASSDSFVIEVTGDEEKIQAFLELVKPLGIKDLARSGVVAIARSSVKAQEGEGRLRLQGERSS